MRSRLDEIVEEECIKGYDGTVAKRIAERAFRHGAERHALWVKSVGDAAANVVPKMVPAPAEEKAGRTHAWDCGISLSVGICTCGNPGRCPFWGGATNDRRRGERRNLDNASRYDARINHYTTMRPGLGRDLYEW